MSPPPRALLAAAGAFMFGMASCCCYTSEARAGSRRSGVRSAAPRVRVRLSEITGSTAVSCDAGMWLKAGRAERRVEHAEVRISRDGTGVGVDVGGEAWRSCPDTVLIQGVQDAFLSVGHREYRGSLLAFVSGDGELVVVNELSLEEYLFGVVPCEIGPINPETYEAVKAQAVAARTFTVSRLGRRKGLGFQLYDTYRRDQEYQGAAREVDLARRAVEETRGQVLTYRGQIAEALYHANCGGVTANGSQPYLKSVRDSPGHRRRGEAFCSGSKHFSWTASVSRAECEQKLAGLLGRSQPALRGFRLEKDRPSGRVVKVRVSTDKGESAVAGSDFRFALGLKSTRFDLNMRGDRVTFEGNGWGHGSGMCQDGAVEMARRGHDYRQILTHYYSGVALESRY